MRALSSTAPERTWEVTTIVGTVTVTARECHEFNGRVCFYSGFVIDEVPEIVAWFASSMIRSVIMLPADD